MKKNKNYNVVDLRKKYKAKIVVSTVLLSACVAGILIIGEVYSR